MKKTTLTLIALSTVCQVAFAQTAKDASGMAFNAEALMSVQQMAETAAAANGPKLVATDAQIAAVMAHLSRFDKDTTFYHWSSFDQGLRWSLAGRVPEAEIDTINTWSGELQAAGPGLYLAEDTKSSAAFGSFPLAVKIAKGTFKYDAAIVNKIFGHELTTNEMYELGKRVPFVRKYSGTWWVTSHTDNMKSLEFGGRLGLKVQRDKLRGFEDIMAVLESITHTNDSFLERLFFLTRYEDGLAFLAAMETNPKNPERSFEPANFDGFRQTYQRFLPRLNNKANVKNQQSLDSEEKGTWTDLNIAGEKFGGTLDQKTWVDRQINQILPMIRKQVAKSWRNVSYRTEGIRAGGPDVGQTFFVSETMALNLQNNPYLETTLTPISGKTGYQASYNYPDVFHYKKLKGRISDELFNAIDSTPPQTLWTNKKLRNSLNQRMVKELLSELFNRYYGKAFNVNSAETVTFLSELISIHPFDDMNGRTLRLYFDLAAFGSNSYVPAFPLSDLDLLTSPQFLAEHLQEAQIPYRDMLLDYVEEYLTARTSRRVPDYAMLNKPFEKRPHANVLKMMKAFGTHTQAPTAAQLQLIKERRFDDLFRQWFGPGWEQADIYSALEVLKNLENGPDAAKAKDYLKTLFKPTLIQGLNDHKQEALLALVKDDPLNVEFLTLLSKNGSAAIRMQLGDLVPTAVSAHPELLQNEAFLGLIKSLASTHTTSPAFYAWLFSDAVWSTPVGQSTWTTWLRTVSKIDDGSAVLAGFSQTPLAKTEAGFNVLAQLTDLKRFGITYAVSNSLYGFDKSLFGSDAAFRIATNMLHTIQTPNSMFGSYQVNLASGLIMMMTMNGVKENDPRVKALYQAALMTNPVHAGAAWSLLSSPAIFNDPQSESDVLNFTREAFNHPKQLKDVSSSVDETVAQSPLFTQILLEGLAKKSPRVDTFISSTYSSLRSNASSLKVGNSIIDVVLANKQMDAITRDTILLNYAVSGSQNDKTFVANIKKCLDQKQYGVLYAIGSKNLKNSEIEKVMRKALVAALKDKTFVIPDNIYTLFPMFENMHVMQETSLNTFAAATMPYLSKQQRVALTSGQMGITTTELSLLSRTQHYRDSRASNPKLFTDLAWAGVKFDDPKLILLVRQLTSYGWTQDKIVPLIGVIPALQSTAGHQALITIIDELSSNVTNSLALWNSFLLPTYLRDLSFQDTVDHWARVNMSHLNQQQRLQVLLSEASLYNGRFAATLRSDLSETRLTTNQKAQLAALLASPAGQASPYRAEILENAAGVSSQAPATSALTPAGATGSVQPGSCKAVLQKAM